MYLAHIEDQFQDSSKAHATTLITTMATVKYNGSSGVPKYILRTNDMASQLKGLDMNFFEILTHVVKSDFVTSGIKSFQSTVKDILVQQGLLKPLLGNKPESMDQDDWEELQAKANGHGRGRGRSRSRNSGHGKDMPKSRGKQNKSSIECWYCKEIGHIARKCPERKDKKNGKKHVNNANVAEEDDKSSDGDLYLVSSVEQQEDGSTDEQSLEDPDEHPNDS
ncbi:hypothetical protein RJ640_017702 [Escallonia rubra]|uniref:CCHC-type domain-containing protein n=1 Tax=Escallonia rubra TaxID=112253 RepID=A0AA88QY89_9ASTE|nr:hypothetical protein RJ640_017702 [Escallonia rubra]